MVIYLYFKVCQNFVISSKKTNFTELSAGWFTNEVVKKKFLLLPSGRFLINALGIIVQLPISNKLNLVSLTIELLGMYLAKYMYTLQEHQTIPTNVTVSNYSDTISVSVIMAVYEIIFFLFFK